MKPMLIAGNWKMNTNESESLSLVNEFLSKNDIFKPEVKVLVCPPFTSISAVSSALKGSKIMLGSQNCHYAEKGAFTGEISIDMISHLGCTHIILGHSERRKYFQETDELINKKVTAVLNKGLIPVFCIGETLEQRQTNQTLDILKMQVETGLSGLSKEQILKVVIAYEPVWAIGTGISADINQIDEAHKFLRSLLTNKVSSESSQIPVLYGGSVDAANAAQILELPDVNGALIGGASLKAASFITIIETAIKILNA
jgi:triosephosphate isomerase (TIM)